MSFWDFQAHLGHKLSNSIDSFVSSQWIVLCLPSYVARFLACIPEWRRGKQHFMSRNGQASSPRPWVQCLSQSSQELSCVCVLFCGYPQGTTVFKFLWCYLEISETVFVSHSRLSQGFFIMSHHRIGLASVLCLGSVTLHILVFPPKLGCSCWCLWLLDW